MSTIGFAVQSGTVTASVVGNMGAMLRTGEDEEREREEGCLSEELLVFGVVAASNDGEEGGE